jgi:hypothetical protein
MASAKPPRRAAAVGVPAEAALMIADVITRSQLSGSRASQFIPLLTLREAKSWAIAAIQLSGGHVSA